MRETRREEEREPGVERDRRGCVARRIAGVDRERLQALDLRPSPLDEQRRRPVGRGLHGDGEQHVRGDPPLALDDHDDRDERDHRGDRVAAGELGPDPGRIRPAVRALARHPVREALVEPRDAVDREQDLRDEEAQGDRSARRGGGTRRSGRERTRRRDVAHRRARRTARRGHRDAARRAESRSGRPSQRRSTALGSAAPALASNESPSPCPDAAAV